MKSAWRDALGVEHPRATDARIVSLVPSLTELLFALELGDQVVGRTTFCIHPAPDVERVPRVGGTKQLNAERFARAAPTHVLVNIDENTQAMATDIEASGARLVVTHPQAPEDNLDLYRLLGGIFDREREAERLCAAFEAAVQDLRATAARRKRLRCLYLIWREPWMTVSADTYIARTLGAAGFDIVGGEAGNRYPEVDVERAREADIALLSSEPFPFKRDHADELRARLGAPHLPVAFIDGEMTSWYGSRAIAGMRYLATFDAKQSADRGASGVNCDDAPPTG